MWSFLIDFFRDEINNHGSSTGRLEYNPLFTKTTQGRDQQGDSKWLFPNVENENLCPVRLFKKLRTKRTLHIKIRRLFLCTNKNWNQNSNSFWFKNAPNRPNQLRLPLAMIPKK